MNYPPSGGYPQPGGYPPSGPGGYPPSGYPQSGPSGYPPQVSPGPEVGFSMDHRPNAQNIFSQPSAGDCYPPSGSVGYPKVGTFYPNPGETYSSPYPSQSPSAPYPMASSYPTTQSFSPSPYPANSSAAFSMPPAPPPNNAAYPATSGYSNPTPYSLQPSNNPNFNSPGPYPASNTFSNAQSSPYPSNPPSASGGPYSSYSSQMGLPSTVAAAGSYTASSNNNFQGRPTVRPAVSFDPSGDASHLRKAMKGLGTDEKAIIQVLGRRTADQRQQIMIKYQQSYGRDLVKDLKSELTGQFEKVILALMTPMATFLAQELNKAVRGIGTKERTLIEILCTRDNNWVRAIKTAYYNLYHCQLEKDVAGDTSGNFQRILVALCTGQRDEHSTDFSICPQLAQVLYTAGEGRWGTDEEEFIRVLSAYSYPILKKTFEEYRKIKGHTFEQAIKSELSGSYREAMLAIYASVENRPAYFASQLHNAMKGLGTKDDTLIRIVISRSEIDMGTIKEEYLKLYGKRLEDAISSETSGDYKKVLLALIQD